MLKRILVFPLLIICLFVQSGFSQSKKKQETKLVYKKTTVKIDTVIHYPVGYKEGERPIKTRAAISFIGNTRGKDTIIRFVVTNDRFYGKAKKGDAYFAYYDTVDLVNDLRVFTSVPVLNEAAKIDTTLATVTPYRGRYAGFRVQFTPKDSVRIHTVKIPFYKDADGDITDVYSSFPEMIAERKLQVRYEHNNPDHIYILTEHPADSATYHYKPKNNFVTINALPLVMTELGFDHLFFKHYAVGLNWSYYYPSSLPGYNFYGIDNGDAQGTYNDIDKSYYKIGPVNRLDLNFKFMQDIGVFVCFVKVFASYTVAQGLSQIYFNSATFNHTSQLADSSVTTFLNESPNNQVAYREVKFVALGYGLGFG
ncbi:MAG TPA: hypothetical protein VN922_21880, partial [Bacteroidia bacterium]|nr:hypothetical protein [Bacteroidia bacterium]